MALPTSASLRGQLGACTTFCSSSALPMPLKVTEYSNIPASSSAQAWNTARDLQSSAREQPSGEVCETHCLRVAGCLTQLLLALGAGIQSRDWPETGAERINSEPAGAHHSKRWSKLRMPLDSRLLPRRCRTGLYLGRATFHQRPHAWALDCHFSQCRHTRLQYL